MRFRHPDGSTVHLPYCTNVHPAEDLAGVIEQLDVIAAEVRRLVDADHLGVGLWLTASTAADLTHHDEQMTDLKAALQRNRLEVVTLNGFPYGGFHDPVVKHAVYRPGWSEQRRLDYTIDLAHILASLLPNDVEQGVISTLPIGWASWVGPDGAAAAHRNLERLATELEAIADGGGPSVVVGLEPEPGCHLDTAAKVVRYVEALGPWIAASLDACHLAVEFEDPAVVLAEVTDAGVEIAKLQVASALRITGGSHEERLDAVVRYAEPRFLHQTRTIVDGDVIAVDDIDDIDARFADAEEWRVHHHQPVHIDRDDTTQDILIETLDQMLSGLVPATSVFEVETYTWTVLPPDRRPHDDQGLAKALATELAWVREQFEKLGLEAT